MERHGHRFSPARQPPFALPRPGRPAVSDDGKRRAALAACEAVRDGMRVGLGTGSTAAHMVAELGRRVAAGLDIVGVPTSDATHRQAQGLGIPLATLDECPELDLTIDGADELDGQLTLIKGGGGALLREKLVAAASRRVLIVADASKRVERLGRFPLPVEIVPFGIETTRRRVLAVLADLGLPAEAVLRRRDGEPVRTDGGNLLLDLAVGAIPDAAALGAALKGTLGVVEHGLFVAMADAALIGTATGVMEIARP